MGDAINRLLENGNLSGPQRDQLRRLKLQIQRAASGYGAMPSPAQIADFLADVRVQMTDAYGVRRDWTPGEWVINAGAWDGILRTGIKPHQGRPAPTGTGR